MGINTKIAKIPFFVLYSILAAFTSYNWIRVILFQKNFEVFLTEQPWDYYLAEFFVKNFGITHQQYFSFAFPIMFLLLYLVPKFFGKLINLDSKTNVKGDNHTAFLLILFIAPVALGVHKFIGSGWRNHLIPGGVLVILFSFWSFMDEQKAKKKETN